MIKMIFISRQKLFLFLKYLHFCPVFLLIYKNGLKRKPWLISKFMISQTGQQIITMRILYNISRSKGNQPIKIGQLINYKGKNVLLHKSC